jgi:hypothetical protein
MQVGDLKSGIQSVFQRDARRFPGEVLEKIASPQKAKQKAQQKERSLDFKGA